MRLYTGTVFVEVLLAAMTSLVDDIRAADRPSPHAFVFSDVGESAGLFPHVGGIRGHGAGWGDVDGDGWIDLYVATFHTDGSKANQFFWNKQGRFVLDNQPSLRISTRGTGVVFADLDNDWDLDLYIGSMPATKDSRLGQKEGNSLAGCSLFRNDGGGRLTNVSEQSGACPAAFGGRSVTVFDFDGDGLLDLLVGEDPITGYNGSPTKSARVFKNNGSLQFEDVSRSIELPDGIPGLGVAAADVNNDGWPDFFLAASGGGNVMFLNDGHGKFREAPGTRKVFDWTASGAGGAGGDNMVCGVCIADVNRDGLQDVVLGQHYSSPWKEPVANRLYLNLGITDGVPTFEDVTDRVGLSPLGLKAPHVEIQDFDNDGWPDIYQTIVKFRDGRPYPIIFKSLGVSGGLPRFREDAWAVNDFPTEEDRAIRRTGDVFNKIIRERKIIYMAAGPSGDFDNDGRLDLFLANWWTESRSLLLRNETPGGNWLRVAVSAAGGVNRMGIGSRVKVYRAGKRGDPSSLLGSRDIAAGYGYASGQPAAAHFGIGDVKVVDVEIVLPHGKGTVAKTDVAANQFITVTHRSGSVR